MMLSPSRRHPRVLVEWTAERDAFADGTRMPSVSANAASLGRHADHAGPGDVVAGKAVSWPPASSMSETMTAAPPMANRAEIHRPQPAPPAPVTITARLSSVMVATFVHLGA
jgi:hypothetical protein